MLSIRGAPECVPQACGTFHREYFALRRCDRSLCWAGDLWRLEDGQRPINRYAIDVVPFSKLLDAPVVFWPPRKHMSLRDPTDVAKKKAGTGDADRSGSEGEGGGDAGGDGGSLEWPWEDDEDWKELATLVEEWEERIKPTPPVVPTCGPGVPPNPVTPPDVEPVAVPEDDVPDPPPPHDEPRPKVKAKDPVGPRNRYEKIPVYDGGRHALRRYIGKQWSQELRCALPPP